MYFRITQDGIEETTIHGAIYKFTSIIIIIIKVLSSLFTKHNENIIGLMRRRRRRRFTAPHAVTFHLPAPQSFFYERRKTIRFTQNHACARHTRARRQKFAWLRAHYTITLLRTKQENIIISTAPSAGNIKNTHTHTHERAISSRSLTSYKQNVCIYNIWPQQQPATERALKYFFYMYFFFCTKAKEHKKIAWTFVGKIFAARKFLNGFVVRRGGGGAAFKIVSLFCVRGFGFDALELCSGIWCVLPRARAF